MKIYIPNSAFIGNIDPFLRSFDPTDPGELTITANDKWIAVHPVVLSMIAALGLKVAHQHINCEPLTAKSRHYLERMGLFKFLGIQSGIVITEHEASGRFVPLTQIKDPKALTKFVTEMTPLLHLEARYAEPIRYIMSELVRNVLEHSVSLDGAVVSAQYFKKTNTIRIGIADTGVGIWQTINHAYKPKNDLESIRLALMPGITGTTDRIGGTDYNAGAGLFFIKSIATVNRDFFMIYSGSALYKLLKRDLNRIKLHADPFDDRHSKNNTLPVWNGTVVGIDISLDQTKEFSVLLDLINETYVKAIKDRKKLQHKRPKFI